MISLSKELYFVTQTAEDLIWFIVMPRPVGLLAHAMSVLPTQQLYSILATILDVVSH